MNKILSLIGKVLLCILIGLLFIFFIIWYKMYNDDDTRKYTGFKRIKESFIIALLYSMWMILAYMGVRMY